MYINENFKNYGRKEIVVRLILCGTYTQRVVVPILVEPYDSQPAYCETLIQSEVQPTSVVSLGVSETSKRATETSTLSFVYRHHWRLLSMMPTLVSSETPLYLGSRRWGDRRGLYRHLVPSLGG